MDGEKVFVLQKIEQKSRNKTGEDVQIGIDVDSKLTGMKGSGTLSIKKVYTRARAVLERLCAGEDLRCQIISKLKTRMR